MCDNKSDMEKMDEVLNKIIQNELKEERDGVDDTECKSNDLQGSIESLGFIEHYINANKLTTDIGEHNYYKLLKMCGIHKVIKQYIYSNGDEYCECKFCNHIEELKKNSRKIRDDKFNEIMGDIKIESIEDLQKIKDDPNFGNMSEEIKKHAIECHIGENNAILKCNCELCKQAINRYDLGIPFLIHVINLDNDCKLFDLK